MAGEIVGHFVGNLTSDPQVSAEQGKTPYARFRLAVTPRTKRGDEWVDGETSFIDCTAFGRQALNVGQSLRRGSRAFVAGRLSHRTWTNNEGQNVTSTQCAVDLVGPEVTFDAARHMERQQSGQQQAPRQAPQQQQAQGDPWAPAGGSQQGQQSGGWGGGQSYDDPPF